MGGAAQARFVGAAGVEGDDARLDLVAIGQAGGVVAAGQAGDERLEALEADVVEAAQLGHRLGVVVDPEVELAPVLVAVDDERRGLLAALVAAGRLARREGGEQPLGERQAPGVTVGGGAGLDHLGPGKHVSGHAEVVVAGGGRTTRRSARR